MKILALITARGGSKRLPRKNICKLGGKPLVVWSIESAKNINEICDVLVSTDDPDIAEICVGAGAYVPWLRPRELAEDTTGSVEVALHALDWYESENGPVDGLLLLQPTSPFRTSETVRQGINLFSDNKQQPVLGVSPVQEHPMWVLKKNGDYMVPFTTPDGFGIRSQDLPEAFVVNGSFYLISPQDLRKYHSFVKPSITPLVIMSPKESLDIDTEFDFKLAEFFLSNPN